MSVPFRLGIDFGTSTPRAFLLRPDGPAEPLSFEGTADVEELLRRIVTEAQRVAGQPVSTATLAHPVGWDEGQRAGLHQAALRAGLSSVTLVAGPIAFPGAPLTVSYTALPSVRPAVGPPPFPGPPHAGPPYAGPPFPGPPFPGAPYPGAPYPGAPYPGPPFPGAAFPGAPYPAGAASGVPVVGVEPIALSLPSGEGITLRGQLRPGYDIVEYIFPEVDGTLPLFRDGNALLREAATVPGDPLYAAASWRTSAIGDDRRFDLAFVPEHLADGPERWFPDYLTRCRDISAQLAIFFEISHVEELLKDGSLLDTLDDTLRRSDGAVLGWKYRRQLARLDTAEAIRQWQTIVDAIDHLIALRD